jgi:predicted RNase H-like HicB family nuclease
MAEAPIVLTVSSRIFKDPESDTGMFVSVIDAWDIAASGRTPEEAMQMTPRLIHAHLEAARKLGVLERELAKVGVMAAPAPHRMHLRTQFAIETEAEISLHDLSGVG